MNNNIKSVKIDKELHKKLKLYCVNTELKISSILNILIVEYLENNNIKNDIK